MRSAIAAIAVLSVGLFSAQAADTSVEVNGFAPTSSGNTVQKRTTVQYGDLNPADRQGATALLERINKAAEAVCGRDRNRASALLAHKVEECREKAVAQAVRDVGSAELTVVASAK